jgi:hypothetical protein
MKSWFIGRVAAQLREFQAQAPHLKDSFGIGQLHPVLEIVAIGLSGRFVSTHRHATYAIRCHVRTNYDSNRKRLRMEGRGGTRTADDRCRKEQDHAD